MSRYIDADKLKNHLIKNRGYVLGHLLHPLLEDVDNQPTADVRKVRHGKWVLRESDGYTRDFYYCSRCKWEALQDDDGDDVLSVYCPHCGAKMVGERRDDAGSNDD